MNHWHPIAHRSELANPGDFIVLPWKSDGEIAVTNIGDDLVAFDNRCSHRGARIFDGLRGNREPRCGYHGRLATAANVKRYEARPIGEFIFACDGDLPTGSTAWGCGDLMAFLRPLTLHSTLAFTMDCHWTVAVENALDFEHVAHVHADSLATMGLKPEELTLIGDGSSIERFSADKVASMARADRLFMRGPAQFDYFHAHLYPYTCLSSTRGWSYSLQHYFPRADGRTNFVHRLYAAETTRPIPGFFDSIARLNERVFREDAEICARVPAHFAGQLGPSEDRIRHFRAALKPRNEAVRTTYRVDGDAWHITETGAPAHVAESEGGEL